MKPDRKKNRKKYLRLRKNRTWLSTFLFVLVSCISVSAIALLLAFFILFIVNSGIEQEYKAKSQLIRIYETIETPEHPYLVFQKAGMDCFIKDSAGNILYAQGADTCSDQHGYYAISAGFLEVTITEDEMPQKEKGITLYADTARPLIRPDGRRSDVMLLDVHMLLKEVNSILRDKSQSADVRIEAPFWEEIPMKNGTEMLVFRGNVVFSLSNIVMIAVIVVFLLALTGIVLIAMILNAVCNLLNQRRINKLFYTDMKINGRNWLWFMIHSEQMLRKLGSARNSYAMVDLEFVDYRRFCICHSVDEGETMLCRIYEALKKQIKRNELLAHSAEDSFALLLRYEDETALNKRLHTILDVLGSIDPEHSFTYQAGVYLLCAVENAGILSVRQDVDIEKDYNNACAACVSLRDSGSSDVAFYDERLIDEQRWVDTVQAMQQRAVEQEEFVVFYQPKYDPRTHELRGAEALIRWESPEYGFLPPYKFIPIFEKNGFITEIDHYMLSHVARAQRQWLDEGQKCVPISVNVSRAHFIESDLAEQICRTVDAAGVPHDLIEIELTESAFFDDKNAMIDIIVKLKQFGFSVSMDDFGAGYSSLNSLKDMPLDVLKLDADFFRGAAADTARGDIVVSETIRLAKSLHMRTVAEGVEIRDQVEFLARQGCDMIQGYYFAKPMPAEEYRERMIQGRNDGKDAETEMPQQAATA